MGMFDSLMDPGQIGQNALLGFQQGRQMRQENDTRNALSTLAQNPNDPNAYQTLAKANPELAIQYRGQMGQQQAAQQKQEQTQMVQLGRLLDYAKDEQTYQQARQAAQQIGIDVSKAPANFNPAWVQQQRMVLSAFEKDGGQQISGLKREFIDAGYQDGSPELAQAMYKALSGKYGSEYYDDTTGQIKRTALPLPQAAPQASQPAQPVKETSFEAASDIARKMGPQFPDFVRNNGFRVRVASPEQAMQLPSGTPLILPDGSEGVVP